MDVKHQIISALENLSKEFSKEKVNFSVGRPEDESFGDYSSNISLIAARILKRNPFDLAQEMAFSVQRLAPSSIEKVEAVKPGFINFYLSKDYLISNLEKISCDNKYGTKPQDPNKKVVVEYSSPNIAKPFTVGHLRSTIIGDAIANLLEANGWKVYRDNHLGDWGTQFGKQIYAIKSNPENEQKIDRSANPVKELVALYVKFHDEAEKNPELEERAREWFKKLEDGDQEARRLWKKCVDWSLKEFENIYKVLGIKFTENNGLGFGESFFEDKIKDVLDELNSKKLLRESEGAKLVFFEKDKYPSLMIMKKDGATLYATRDLATDKFRLGEYGKDTVIINEVGIEQSLYFNQLFEVEEMLGWVKEGQRIHIKHGHYRFKDEKMSTRKGNVIWLEEVLGQAIQKAYDLQFPDLSGVSAAIKTKTQKSLLHLNSRGGKVKIEERARNVGIGALKWNDLKRTSNLDIVFDWDEILNMQGDSGPYLQYTYARTQSVLAKTKTKISFARSHLSKLEAEEGSLLRSLIRFSEVVEQAAENFAPEAPDGLPESETRKTCPRKRPLIQFPFPEKKRALLPLHTLWPS